MILDDDMTQNLRKELKELNEKNGEEYRELIALQDARTKDTRTP